MTFKPLALAGASLLLLAGCDYIDDEVHQRAAAVDKELSAVDARISQYRPDLDMFLSRDAAGSCMSGAQAASFRGQLQDARAAVGRATALQEDRLKPILEDDDGDFQAKAEQLISEAFAQIGEARAALEKLRQRVVTVNDVRDRPASYLDALSGYDAEIARRAEAARGLVARAQEAFPERAADARTDFEDRAEIDFLLASAEVSGTALQTVSANVEANQTGRDWNCVTVADSYRDVAARREKSEEMLSVAETDFADLYRHETRVLVDMKAVYTVQVGRSSWDYSGGPDVNHVFEPTEVPVSTYEHVVQLEPDARLAFKDKNWDEERSEVGEEHWRHLRPDEPFEAWPHEEHHDEASYWVNDWDWNHFHKYRVVSEDGVRTTDWISVDASDFEYYKDALHMEVASKPIGAFADETMTVPAPPGMSLVGDPRYGEWRETTGEEEQETAQAGGTGALWWYFLGRWSGLNAPVGDRPYHYSRASHRTWQRDFAGSKPYYGAGPKDGPKPFGTNGTLVKSTGVAQSSTFMRTGGPKRHYVPASVRGAGPAGRGGGPGGGGK